MCLPSAGYCPENQCVDIQACRRRVLCEFCMVKVTRESYRNRQIQSVNEKAIQVSWMKCAGTRQLGQMPQDGELSGLFIQSGIVE